METEMFGEMNTIRGIPYFVSEHAGTNTTEFTRKQTRKFKNTRWVKKYLKKHSYQKFHPGAYEDRINGCLYIHPLALRELQESLNQTREN